MGGGSPAGRSSSTAAGRLPRQDRDSPAADRRLPRWLDREVKLAAEIAALNREPSKISAEDRKRMEALIGEANKSFGALRYADYVRAVTGLGSVVERYSKTGRR